MIVLAGIFNSRFEELTIGERFSTSPRAVREADILAFAALTGDSHPQHVDHDWAADSPFGEQIAHGLLVLSWAVGLLPLDPERVVALRRISDAVFKQPVKVGDEVHVDGKITALTGLDGEQGLVETTLRILNQDDRLVARLRAELVWR